MDDELVELASRLFTMARRGETLMSSVDAGMPGCRDAGMPVNLSPNQMSPRH